MTFMIACANNLEISYNTVLAIGNVLCLESFNLVNSKDLPCIFLAASFNRSSSYGAILGALSKLKTCKKSLN